MSSHQIFKKQSPCPDGCANKQVRSVSSAFERTFNHMSMLTIVGHHTVFNNKSKSYRRVCHKRARFKNISIEKLYENINSRNSKKQIRQTLIKYSHWTASLEMVIYTLMSVVFYLINVSHSVYLFLFDFDSFLCLVSIWWLKKLFNFWNIFTNITIVEPVS